MAKKPLRSTHFVLSVRRSIDGDGGLSGLSLSHLFWLAIPKRLLKRAVDRNAVRRIAKEAWRKSAKQASGSHLADHSVPVLLRLHRRPDSFATMGRPARKRFWRAELDQLILRYWRVK